MEETQDMECSGGALARDGRDRRLRVLMHPDGLTAFALELPRPVPINHLFTPRSLRVRIALAY